MNIRLSRNNDQVYAHIDDNEGIAVKLVWARPATGQGKEISVLSQEKEVAFLESIDVLDEVSKKIAETELLIRYFVPKVSEIVRTDVHLGNRYFEVKTDRGPRKFVIKNPYTNIRSVDKDGILINDVFGNLFCIPSLSSLDLKSKEHLERVI
ncbi:DUF1854 domain-containing protein [Chitinispirillales bacterium ANBcel5]|uniref:DUF1854 domain-containing protein n=1 Tax=Cellulosispirillum alkaliphilum TaxID=3039283 RepID=UPI002A5549E8|nr:DUF1854 domain-containing protein [Chitinispirillales bacterium ANBcel5]